MSRRTTCRRGRAAGRRRQAHEGRGPRCRSRWPRWRPPPGACNEQDMTPGELLPELEGLSADLAITGLVQDSREVTPGNAFVAIGGFSAHGLHFVDAAREFAAAILYEPPAPAELPAPADAIPVADLRTRMGAMADLFHGHPSAAMTTVGVTGTNGKTSTVQLLAQAWTLRGQKAASWGRWAAASGLGLDGAHRLHHAAGVAPACVAGGVARRGCIGGGDGGVVARASTGPRGRRAVRRRGVHQPHPRPSRLPRRHGSVTARPRRGCSTGGISARRRST